MSFESLKRLRNTTGFRLTLWYSGLFILSTLTLFGVAYLLLASTLQRKDRETLQLQLQEYVAAYQRGGLAAVETALAEQKQTTGKVLFFVRMAKPDNHTLSMTIPSLWDRFDLSRLETDRGGLTDQEIQIPIPGEDEVLEILSARLPDGALLQVGLSTEEREDVLEDFRSLLAGIIVPMMFIGLGGGAFVAWRALRPIRDLVRTLQSILGTGKLTARAPVMGSGDELDELSALFNQMLDRIGVLITNMQQTLDNVAHDLRTPMTRLRGMAEAALQEETAEDPLRAALVNCVEESDRILAMLNTLMDISEAETGTMRLTVEQVNVRDLIDHVVELYRYVAEDKEIVVSTTASPDLNVAADRNRLQQAIANLVDNAIKYTPGGGHVMIKAFQRYQQACITVSDNGIGIPPEELSQIWNRLYRGDKSRSQRGLGLGLCVVKAIAQAHKGEVAVASQPDSGSQFSLSLPLAVSP